MTAAFDNVASSALLGQNSSTASSSEANTSTTVDASSNTPVPGYAVSLGDTITLLAENSSSDWRTPSILMSPTKMHLWPEEAKKDSNGNITYGAMIEQGTTFRKQLWYKIPASAADFVTESCDPYILGSLFIAAVNSADLVVHGQASPSLLRNLIDFQNAWKSWWPQRFSMKEISADKEIEDLVALETPKAICAYSGGVDSNFTLYRHLLIDIGRQKRNIETALLIHGLDLPLRQEERFEKISAKSRALLEGIGVDLITLKTNFREINPDWNFTHGAALASALMLFKKQFSEGVIASTYFYQQLLLPWGSNPISDPLMSSDSFQVVHDAPHWSRFAKIAALKSWPEAYDNLRVCFELDAEERNCGKCFKCVCTWIGAKSAKLEAPRSLPAPTVEAILALRNVPEPDMFGMDDCVNLLKETDVPKPLIKAFKTCLNFNRRRHLFERQCSDDKPGFFYRTASKIQARLSRYFT